MHTKSAALFQRQGMDYPIACGIVVIHVLAAVLGILFFSWPGVVAFLVLAPFTGMLGVTTGYHRLLTHKSFKTFRPVRWFFAFAGTVAGQGPVFKWVADHRVHHQHSDHEGDPHSPVVYGFWHSHVLWTALGITPEQRMRLYANVRDLCRDPVLVALNRAYIPINLAVLALLTLGGWWWGGWRCGMSLLAWGGFVRLVYVYHVTWCVNSATHLWGYRNYSTTDQSRNLWWVGLLAFGEGWHNNHHHSQTTAFHGQHRWWELDPTYWLIWSLEKCGLVWDVQKEVISSS